MSKVKKKESQPDKRLTFWKNKTCFKGIVTTRFSVFKPLVFFFFTSILFAVFKKLLTIEALVKLSSWHGLDSFDNAGSDLVWVAL